MKFCRAKYKLPDPGQNTCSCMWKVVGTELTLTIQKWDLGIRDNSKKICSVFSNAPKKWMFRIVRNPKSSHGFKRKMDKYLRELYWGLLDRWTPPGSGNPLNWKKQEAGKILGQWRMLVLFLLFCVHLRPSLETAPGRLLVWTSVVVLLFSTPPFPC